jgi:hypothetical protein
MPLTHQNKVYKSRSDRPARSGPVRQDTSVSGPVRQDTSVSGPVRQDTSVSGPVRQDTSVSGPVRQDTSVSGPVRQDTSVSGPVRQDTSAVTVRDMSDFHRLSCRQLKREIHRPLAHRPRPMTNPARNRKHLSRLQLPRSAPKFNAEPSFNHQKRLIRVRMKVPVVRLNHRGYPNHMIVDLCDWMIVVSNLRRRLRRQRNDLWKYSTHHQTSHPNLIP